jgi:hypothetical protein
MGKGHEFSLLEGGGLQVNPPAAIESLAANGVWSTGIDYSEGILIVSTGGNSAVFTIHRHLGTPATTKVSGSAKLNAAKDNASTVNVYWESGQIKVQNKFTTTVNVNMNGHLYPIQTVITSTTTSTTTTSTTTTSTTTTSTTTTA